MQNQIRQRRACPAKLQRSGGMTLIELLVTISIIGILAATLTPTVSRYLPGISLKGTTETLNATLREAQENAIITQKRYIVRFDTSTDPDQYKLIKVTAMGPPPVEEVIRTVPLKNGATMFPSRSFSQSADGKYQVEFTLDGGPVQAGYININQGSAQKVVTVTSAGFIYIYQGN